MGLFGKRVDIPDGIKIQFYDGELPGFICNFPCQLLLMDDKVRITKVNPYVEVFLNKAKIKSIDILREAEYMAKYKGNAATTALMGSKDYYIINYTSSDGVQKHIDFWGTPAESIKIMKMRKQILNNATISNYEL
ncbi:MAG: hypothetical protein E7250_05420 [Paenibacillaceae bacterium]|nr:hypothetical protein [Paenibacillaceae bacterium]